MKNEFIINCWSGQLVATYSAIKLIIYVLCVLTNVISTSSSFFRQILKKSVNVLLNYWCLKLSSFPHIKYVLLLM